MDAESLKIILELKKENILLKRAITDATVALVKRKMHLVMSFDLEETNGLFAAISDILEELNRKN